MSVKEGLFLKKKRSQKILFVEIKNLSLEKTVNVEMVVRIVP
jgi:hypothetical protein